MGLDREDVKYLPSTDREALRELLREQGFVFSKSGMQLRTRRGALVPWLFYGGEINLSFDGLRLMARALLERLEGFSATQLATYGQSAVPLLSACVLYGDGRYTGLAIRKEPKAYGSGRRIDGPLDRARAAVFIDESLASGASAYEGIAALESEGVTVEGVVCVVEFTGYGAADWLRSRGYRVETVFDVWSDLAKQARRREEPSAGDEPPWATEQIPSGLTAAEVAREVINAAADRQRIPRPPLQLDRFHDASSGTFVSIRRRSNDERLVRAGVQHHNWLQVEPGREVVLAAWEAARLAPAGSLSKPEEVKIAVSFLGRPEQIRPAEIVHEHQGLLVRGVGPLDRIGAALPNTPHYDDELQQYRYARNVASFGSHEPHLIYRQPVERILERGQSWPPYGAPQSDEDWTGDDRWAAVIGLQVQQLLASARGQPVTEQAIRLPEPPEQVFGVGVSLYAKGLLGCALGFTGDLNSRLSDAFAGAFRDTRYRDSAHTANPTEITFVVSLLLRRRKLGHLSPERLGLFYRLGRDTLQAIGKGRSGLVLAHFAVEQSSTSAKYQEQVLRKAELTADSATWFAYETVGWIVDPERSRATDLAFPSRSRGDATPSGMEEWRNSAKLVANFILRSTQADGAPAYLLRPWSGNIEIAGTATRILIALTGLLQASTSISTELSKPASALLDSFIDRDRVRLPRSTLVWDASSDAQLLTCLSLLQRLEHRPLALRLVGRLRRLIGDDGAIYQGRSRVIADLDFLSGSVLLALAQASAWLQPVDALDGIDLERCLAFAKRRFEGAHPWGMVWWHGQAWCALADRLPAAAAFSFELTDWALERQLNSTGAFVVDNLEPQRASFLTACVLECVATARALAIQLHDGDRAARYERSWIRGMQFVERLIIRPGDAFFSPAPDAAVGGVRATLASSDLRIDYAGHTLQALAKGIAPTQGS